MNLIELKTFLEPLPKIDLITIDLGNTRSKVAHFEKGNIVSEALTSSTEEIKEDLSDLPSVICSVRKEVPSSFSNFFSNNQFFDMPVHYEKTLGHDRLVSSYLIYHWLKEEVLLIDCGTFITLDFVSPKGFEGGYIVPGIKTLGEAYKRGNQLFEPQINSNTSIDCILPQSTKEAMTGGHSLLIEGLFLQIEKWNRRIVLTGGGAVMFKERFPEATICPQLLHYAMYFQYVKNNY